MSSIIDFNARQAKPCCLLLSVVSVIAGAAHERSQFAYRQA
jgi:hypothetical protein